MSEKFPKTEKLKREKLIKKLFEDGIRIKAFPLVLVYTKVALPEEVAIQAGFSVPKRLHKTAVARNRLKRLLREVYRKQKHCFETSAHTYAFMFIYTGKHKANYAEVEQAFKKVYERFNQQSE